MLLPLLVHLLLLPLLRCCSCGVVVILPIFDSQAQVLSCPEAMPAKSKSKGNPPATAAMSCDAAPPTKRHASPTAGPVTKVAANAWDGRLPPNDFQQDAEPTIRHVMQVVHDELPSALRSAVGAANAMPETLFDVQPLQIKDTLADGELSTFKPPWQRAQCLMAIKSTGLYEAACNLFWLDCRSAHRLHFDLPVARPSWATVHEVFERMFSTSASGFGGVTPGSSTRLYFPVTIPAFVLDEKQLDTDTFAGTLLLASGHTLVYSWFLAMWHALQSKDRPWMLRLWECALTVSVRVRRVTPQDPRPVILDSWSFSESVQVAKLACSDSFVVFAAKVASFAKLYIEASPKANQDSVIKHLVSQGVRFNGAALNATMYKMANSVHGALDTRSLAQVQILEWKYGPELLSTSYNKLGRLVQVAQKSACAIPNSSIDECLLFCLQMMDYSVVTGLVRSAKFFTMDIVDKQKDGAQGWFGMTCNKFKFLQFMRGPFLANMLEYNEAFYKTARDDVLPQFQDPESVLKAYPVKSLEHSAIDEDDGSNADAGMTANAPKLSPVAIQLRDLLCSVYRGEFDACFKQGNLEQAARDMLASTAEGDRTPMQPLHQAYDGLLRSAATMAVVSSEPDAVGNSRALQREGSAVSDDGNGEIRQNCLKRASVERKKYVQFVVVPRLAKSELDAAFARSGIRNAQTGKDSHRLFVCCADLIVEHPSEPWIRSQGPDEKTLTEIADWFKEMKGGYDWLLLFDGRNRETLQRLQKLMQGRPHLNELTLLFVGGGRAEVGRTRKVAFGANNVETALVFPPWPRTSMSAKPRTAFNVLGESSTHDITYSGIPFRSRKAIPRIAEKDKAEIVGMSSPAGVPENLTQEFSNPILFWQEAKPVELYEQLLADFDARSVFDVSPGSGALAEACLRLGISYVGVTTRMTHATWLSNVLDRMVLGHIVMPGRPCYQKDFAAEVRTHVSDILRALEEAESADDIDMDPFADQ
jgi:hypothetical protein